MKLKKLFKALAKGKKVRMSKWAPNEYMRLNEEGEFVFSGGTFLRTYTFQSENDFEICEEEKKEKQKQWWEDIPPEGVDCFVWDNFTQLGTVRRVVRIENGKAISAVGTHWSNAVPLNLTCNKEEQKE